MCIRDRYQRRVHGEGSTNYARTNTQMKVSVAALCFLFAVSLAAEPKKVLIPVANDIEEVEFLSVYDALYRAGAHITVASANANAKQVREVFGTNTHVFLSHKELSDEVLNRNWDAIVLPGGLGCAKTLGNHQGLVNRLKKQKSSGKVVAAVCASSPLVLGANGLLNDVEATGVPDAGLRKLIPNKSKIDNPVVVSRNIITAQGPGSSLDWAIAIINAIYGSAKAQEIAKLLIVNQTAFIIPSLLD
eukprot:TRINITY_DN3670_c0_g2_i1.p1 TRINITY_DN3670_c0_g2~~TRINITY_DN3670_c0_g2_i1.p1  ORF type:complete len:262 (+),score=103.93 TRINITY_DN3670_c0_g2_i1:49-786(+)